MPADFPRALIFDWDNTLVDSWGAIADAMNHTLAHFGRPLWSMDEVMANCTRAARDSFPEWFGGRWQEASDVFYGRFSQVQMRNLKPLPGSAELLQWLKSRNIPAFVVSNKNGEYLRREAAALKWDNLFVSIVGSTDAPRDKPAREHVDYALAPSGIKADADVWFVGDNATDVQCARNAGCTPVLIGPPGRAGQLAIELVFSDCHALQTLLYNRLNEA